MGGGFLQSFQRKFSRPQAPAGQLIYAIGDIHGRADLLGLLLSRIRRDAARQDMPAAAIFLGDYIDKGPEGRAVIDMLTRGPLPGFETIFLKGNHEAELFRFLAEPMHGPLWASYGGAATLRAYGVEPPQGPNPVAGWRAAHLAFRRAVPLAHRAFFQRLKLMEIRGDYAFVHAGVRPDAPLSAQTPGDLLEIRGDFLNGRTTLEKVIVHGHSPFDRPYRDARRIGIDTGAFETGVLTALRLQGEEAHFIQASEADVLRLSVFAAARQSA